MIELKELKDMNDSAFNNGVITRERAADDMVFYWVTQWDDIMLAETELAYRGEFNILRKAGRQIMADLRANPIQLNFDAKDPDREDGADLIDGLYLSSERFNTCQEAFNNADGEAVVCGVGAYEYFTEYESNNSGDIKQVVKTRPVYEANNNCLWDPNAKLLDKSDAMFVSLLTMYSEEGYIDLAMDLKGYDREEALQSMSSFSQPQQSYAFPWAAGKNEGVYIVSFYHRELIKDTIVTLHDPMGQEFLVRKVDLEEIEDDLIEDGYEFISEKKIDRWEVRKYIASGSEILSSEVIAGENIPIVPVYGERAFIEGEEHYEGVTRLAKDPQRLRNFQMSYLADMVSRSPRPKPIFNAEQVQGFEFMYQQTGSENNLPYYLTNRKTADGSELLAPGPSVMPEQQVPQALMLSMQESREAVNDVANAGLPNDLSDIDLSGKAFKGIEARLDQQSIVYQENRKHARRRGGEIFASMASTIYDTPRKVTITKPDGTRVKSSIMESVLDKDTGEMVVLNDITNMEFEVYADIGPSYSSKREQTIDQLEALGAQAVAMGDMELGNMLLQTQMTMVDGVALDSIRKYSRKKLVLAGVQEPDTPEEEEMVAQQAEQAQNQQDPMQLAAQAEMVKGEAAMAETQRKVQMDKMTTGINQQKVQIDTFKAQTERMELQVDAQFKGAEIDYKRSRTMGQKIDNLDKEVSSYRSLSH